MKSFITTACAVIGLLIASPIFAAPLPTTTGPITVMQSGHSLFINGNNDDNLIWFGQFPNGDIAVLGLGGANGQTLINGDADNFGRYSGVKNIFVNTFGGNDLVIGTNNIYALHYCLDFDILDEIEIELPDGLGYEIFIPGELEIVTGSGYDVVALGGVGTGYNMEIFTDNDRDEVGLCDIYVGKHLLVITGNGDDDVLITGFEFDLLFGDGYVNFVNYNVTIDTGSGNDDVCVGNLVVDHGSLVIVTLDGHDEVRIGACFYDEPEEGTGGKQEGFVFVRKELVINTGNGNDDVLITDTLVGWHTTVLLGNGYNDLGIFFSEFDRSVFIYGGQERDNVLLSYVDIGGDLSAHLGNGNDEAEFSEVFIGANLTVTLGGGIDRLVADKIFAGKRTHIDAGNDRDTVGLFASIFNSLNVFMGNGNDALFVKFCEADQFHADGGPGDDYLSTYENVFLGESINGFNL